MAKLFKSYAACESAYQKASHEQLIVQLVLQCVVRNGKAIHCRQGKYSARVYNANHAHGGLVLVIYKQSPDHADDVTAHYIDEWCADRNVVLPHYTDKEGQDYRQLKFDVLCARNTALNLPGETPAMTHA